MASYNYTFQSGDGVTPTRLNDARTVSDIVNADIKSDAAIAGSKIDPQFNAPTTVSVNSASTALRVTQEGAGNALVVEDSTNPDSTPLVVNNAGQIISGATTAVEPDSGLQLVGQSTSAPNGSVTLSFYDSSSGSTNATFRSQRARGSLLAPQIVQNGDAVGSISFRGYDGSQFRAVAAIVGVVDGSPSASSMPGSIVFRTTPSGSFGVVDRMHIDANGNVGIGTSSANAAALLDVSSTTKGFLPPRMTTAQRDAISTPPAGLVIYNTSTNVLNFYNGSAWGAV